MRRIILTDHFKQQLDPDFFEELTDYEVFTAYSNEEALKIHRAQNAHLIITELYGSGINAVQFCSMLREDAGAGRVAVIVYHRDNEIEREAAAHCRANALLPLPVSRKLLRETMQRFLRVPPRRVFHRDFSAQRIGGSLPAALTCRIENISESGMLIETSANLRQGDKLSCTLNLPTMPTFVTQAEVVRTGGGPSAAGSAWYGVRFTRLDITARKAIDRILSVPPHPAA